MGFGILFIGYFLLLNLTYYGYTDLIAALVMLMAFYKLSSFNRHFKTAIIPTLLFALVAMVELAEALLSTLGMNMGFIIEYTAASRYLLIGVLTVFMLMGIREIAKEVGASITESRARYSTPFTYVLFALGAIFEFPSMGNLIPSQPLAIIALILLLSIFLLMITVLITVYSAYMHICMPEDIDNDAPDKASRFGFVNKFKEHENERNREYAEYKINKSINKNDRKKRRK